MLYLIFLGMLAWVFIFSLGNGKGSKIPWAIRGGPGDDPDEPAPPPPAPAPDETSAQAIQAQIDAVPKQLATQQEFGPQFTQLNLENVQRFGPQFAQAGLDLSKDFGGQFAEQQIAEQNILDPSRAAGSAALTEFLEQGPDELSPEDLATIRQDTAAASASRGLSQSGFSADAEVSRIFGARQALKDRFLNIALSASGRLPAAQTGSTVSPGQTSTGSLIQNVNPSTFFGGQASQNQANASVFNTQGSIFGNQLAAQPPGVGGLIAGSLASGFGSAIGTGVGFKLAGG